MNHFRIVVRSIFAALLTVSMTPMVASAEVVSDSPRAELLSASNPNIQRMDANNMESWLNDQGAFLFDKLGASDSTKQDLLGAHANGKSVDETGITFDQNCEDSSTSVQGELYAASTDVIELGKTYSISYKGYKSVTLNVPKDQVVGFAISRGSNDYDTGIMLKDNNTGATDVLYWLQKTSEASIFALRAGEYTLTFVNLDEISKYQYCEFVFKQYPNESIAAYEIEPNSPIENSEIATSKYATLINPKESKLGNTSSVDTDSFLLNVKAGSTYRVGIVGNAGDTRQSYSVALYGIEEDKPNLLNSYRLPASETKGTFDFICSSSYKQYMLVVNSSTKDAAGYALTYDEISSPSTVQMHRLYNPYSGEHFYTSNIGERDHLSSLGWAYEGIGWTAPATGDPVYRLYNRFGGEHHYTLDAAEKDALVNAGWEYEGIGWYSDVNKTVPVYRQYNPFAYSNNHNYTPDLDEHNYLVSLGWKDENIAWYGVNK